MREWWTAQPKFLKWVNVLVALPSALYLFAREDMPGEMDWSDAVAFGLFFCIALFNAGNVMNHLQGRSNG